MHTPMHHHDDIPTTAAVQDVEPVARPQRFAAFAAPLMAASEVDTSALAGKAVPVLGVALVAGLAYAAVTGGRRSNRRQPETSIAWRVKLHWWPGPGYATRLDLWRFHGRRTARRVAKHGRKRLSWSDRRFGPAREYATFHGRAMGWIHRWGVYSTFEDLTIMFSPPQEGKSSDAAAKILDAPGPCVVTTIRGDLYADTAGLREQVGTVWSWDPEGATPWGSNFRWNPVAGCADIVVAVRRAGYMVEAQEAKGLSEADFWADQASMMLASTMHAAALVGGDMRMVYHWIMSRSDDPIYILHEHDGANETARQVVVNFIEHTPDKTRDSVISTLTRVLKFMINPSVVRMLSPTAGPGFDFHQFLLSSDTLYLASGISGGSPVAPLFAAFLAELAETSLVVGAYLRTKGLTRLDPPLTMVLDEIANTAPVPVDRWASWAAGTGIRIFLFFQTWAQVERRWGGHGAAALWASCKVKIITSGVSENKLLRLAEELGGKVRVREDDDVTTDRYGKERRRKRYGRINVVEGSVITQLPRGHAVLFSRNAPPTIIKLDSIRARKEFKQWRKSGAQPQIFERPVYEIPQVRPELARRPEPQPLPEVPDELGQRRAQRQPHQAPSLFPPEVREVNGGQAPPPSWGSSANQPPPPVVPPAPQSTPGPSWYRPAEPPAQQPPADAGWSASYGPGPGGAGLPAQADAASREEWGWWPEQDGKEPGQ